MLTKRPFLKVKFLLQTKMPRKFKGRHKIQLCAKHGLFILKEKEMLSMQLYLESIELKLSENSPHIYNFVIKKRQLLSIRNFLRFKGQTKSK